MHEFLTAPPFPHIVRDCLFDGCELAAISREIDQMPWDAWHRYDSPDEQGKRACHQPYYMGHKTRALIDYLTSEPCVKLAEQLTGLTGLSPDPTLYGGGVHVTEPGGFLGLHLDNEVHPKTGMHRRLNLIVYLSPNRQESHGGHLQLWDRERHAPVTSIPPRFARTVLMETGPHSYHSVSQTSTTAPPRKSIAVYYWSPPCYRARFLPTAAEAPDAALEEVRLRRAGV